MQIQVETNEINRRRPEVFRSGKVGVSAQALRIDPLRFDHQFIKEPGCLFGARPAHDIRGNLIADAEGEHAGVAAASAHRFPDRFLRLLPPFSPVQKTHVLRPRDVHQHAQASLQSHLQEPARRYRIDTDDVRSQLHDPGEILRGLFGRGKRLPCRVQRKGAVSDSFYKELGFTQTEEFAVNANTRPARNGGHGA